MLGGARFSRWETVLWAGKKARKCLVFAADGKKLGKSRVSWIYPGVPTFSKVRESLFLFVLWVSGDVTDGVAFGVLCFAVVCNSGVGHHSVVRVR